MRASIEARAVTHRTRAGRVTIRDISLTVGQGELVAIIGGSGSGKATLLDVLSGRYPPTAGTVCRHPGRQAGYVPAGDSLPQVLPLARALRYTAALRGAADFRGQQGTGLPEDNGDAVAEALSLVGLASSATVPVGMLNPGERKRAEIAAEVLAGPAALFLDEPTTALDPAQANQVLRLLRRLSDTGSTVLFTTSSSLEAARCDKVAVLAVGGHLAFFGTPAGARGYFGADSLEEIYERLSGIGDPAAAWSRRFFDFSAAAAGSTPVPAAAPSPEPVPLIPDQAGPHSAGRPSPLFPHEPGPEDSGPEDSGPENRTGRGLGYRSEQPADLAPGRRPAHGRELDSGTRTGTGPAGQAALPAPTGGPASPARQLTILVSRNAEVLARDRLRQATLAAIPLAVLVVLCVLLGVGALDGAAPVTLAWAVLGGLVTGLAYELPVRASEARVFRRERFTGLSVPAFLAAKAALLVPALAIADVIILAVPATAARLQAGFAVSYLSVFISSLVGVAAAFFPGIARYARA